MTRRETTGRIRAQAAEDWTTCGVVPAFALRCTPEQVTAKLGAAWTEDVEDGLGPVLLMGLEQDGVSRFVLVASAAPDGPSGIVVEVDAAVDFWSARWDILRALGLTSADIDDEGWFVSWGTRTAQPTVGTVWRLWRQDDHGNVVQVRDFRSKDSADAARARFASGGHRQTYWVEPVDT